MAGQYLGGLPIIGGGTVTVGASAPIFGLLGALVYYGRRTGSRHIGDAGLQYALMMGIFGLIWPGVDNQAHLGGFVGGFLAGMLLDPLKPERVDHLVARGGLPAGDPGRGGLVGGHGAAAAGPLTVSSPDS